MGDMADELIDSIWDSCEELDYCERESHAGDETPHCPFCDDEMHLVDGKYGKFYGCNSYPKCKGSKKYYG